MMNDLLLALVAWGIFIAGFMIGVKHGFHRGEVIGSRKGFKRGIDVSRQAVKWALDSCKITKPQYRQLKDFGQNVPTEE